MKELPAPTTPMQPAGPTTADHVGLTSFCRAIISQLTAHVSVSRMHHTNYEHTSCPASLYTVFICIISECPVSSSYMDAHLCMVSGEESCYVVQAWCILASFPAPSLAWERGSIHTDSHYHVYALSFSLAVTRLLLEHC